MMAPLGTWNVACDADKSEVLGSVPAKQMQINNFSTAVFIGQSPSPSKARRSWLYAYEEQICKLLLH